MTRSILAAAIALAALPAAMSFPSAGAAASPCRPTFLVSAPASAEIQKTVAITASVLNCILSVFLGDCVLEAQVGSKFVTLDSGAVLGLGNCDFPTSSNTAAKRTFRIRFSLVRGEGRAIAVMELVRSPTRGSWRRPAARCATGVFWPSLGPRPCGG